MQPIPFVQKGTLAILLFLLVSLQACILVVDEDDLYGDDALHRSRWRLNVVVYLGRSYSVLPGEIYTVHFDTRSDIAGRADCNDYDGSYNMTLLGGIRINNLYVTDAHCGRDSLQDFFLDGLDQARSYEVQGETLTIRSRGDDYVLYFYRD